MVMDQSNGLSQHEESSFLERVIISGETWSLPEKPSQFSPCNELVFFSQKIGF